MAGTIEGHAAPAPAAKQDPETLVLRGRPRPAVRFRRGLIIGLTAAFSAAIVGLSWFALDPPSFRPVADGGGAGDPFRAPSLDALDKAPNDYGDVPRLGPPLPGDLGRPILEQRREAAAALAGPEDQSSPALEAERARAEAAEQRQQATAKLEAARASALLVQLSGSPAGHSATLPAQVAAARADPAMATDGEARPSAFGLADGGSSSPHRLRPPQSPWTLSAGTVIPASLITGLNSDLPGIVVAQVTEPVRDSATGRTVLIPQGARLIGNYDNRLSFGQRRALLVWNRIVFPDASSIQLDKMPASDSGGYAGIEDRVDFHTGRLVKGIALSTLLGVGTELSLGGEGALVRAVRESAQQDAARAGNELTRRNLDIQPSVTVRPGWPVRAILHQDLVLQPWKG